MENTPTFSLEGEWKGTGTVLASGTKYNEMFSLKVLKTEPAIVVNWQQFTKSQEGKPMHAENGFLKILPKKLDNGSNVTELMLSHPFGVNELSSGSWDSEKSELKSIAADASCFQRGKTASGKTATHLSRTYTLSSDGQTLSYDVHLGVDGSEPKHHLHCEM